LRAEGKLVLDQALPEKGCAAKLPLMHFLARFLQLAGLAIPPLAMVAQLNEQIKAGQMLQFLCLSVGIFMLGYAMQRYGGTK